MVSKIVVHTKVGDIGDTDGGYLRLQHDLDQLG